MICGVTGGTDRTARLPHHPPMRPALTLTCLLLTTLVASTTPADDDTRTVLTGVVTKVIDADTVDVKLASGPIRIRLHGIDSPERGQPWEDESTAALKERILGKQVDVEPFQQDRYDRLIGIIFLGDIDINAELVQHGHAWAYRRYMRKSDAALCADEAQARLAKRGLWSLPKNDRIAPWEWRRRKTLEAFTDYSNETTQHCVASIGKK